MATCSEGDGAARNVRERNLVGSRIRGRHGKTKVHRIVDTSRRTSCRQRGQNRGAKTSYAASSVWPRRLNVSHDNCCAIAQWRR